MSSFRRFVVMVSFLRVFALLLLYRLVNDMLELCFVAASRVVVLLYFVGVAFYLFVLVRCYLLCRWFGWSLGNKL
jgi:hypothetical protein